MNTSSEDEAITANNEGMEVIILGIFTNGSSYLANQLRCNVTSKPFHPGLFMFRYTCASIRLSSAMMFLFECM